MAFIDRRTTEVLATTVFLALALAIVYYARRIILIFIIAILFAYLLDPIVRFLQRHSLFFRDLRGPAVLEVYFAFLILIAFLLYGVSIKLSIEPRKLVQTVPILLDGLSNGELANGIGSKYGWSDAQTFRLRAVLETHREDIENIVKDAEHAIPSVISGLILVPILAIFFLRDGRRIADGLIRLIAHCGDYDGIPVLADELNATLQKYIRTKVTLAGLSLLFYCAVLLLLHYPHAIALGLMGGVLEFIPVAGWMVSAATIVSVGVLTQSHWIWMAALLGIWRVIQDYSNAPRIMGRQLEIHPLMSLFGLMVGWEIDGIIGVYLSVPLMAVVGVIWRTRFHSRTETEKHNKRDLIETTQASVQGG
jgi:predicted PurR-regulated permease PerM